MRLRATGTLLAALVVNSLALVPACSSTSSSPTSPTTSSTTSATSTSHGAFGECLRKHGVPEAPGPTGGLPPGVDQTTWDNAIQACGTLAPAPPGPSQ